MSRKIETSPRTKLDRVIRDCMLRVFQLARPGTKVRAVTTYDEPGLNCPQAGKVYTIRELRRGLWATWAVGFTLDELVNEIDPERGSEPFWPAHAFSLLEDEVEWRKFVNQLLTGHDWPN